MQKRNVDLTAFKLIEDDFQKPDRNVRRGKTVSCQNPLCSAKFPQSGLPAEPRRRLRKEPCPCVALPEHGAKFPPAHLSWFAIRGTANAGLKPKLNILKHAAYYFPARKKGESKKGEVFASTAPGEDRAHMMMKPYPSRRVLTKADS